MKSKYKVVASKSPNRSRTITAATEPGQIHRALEDLSNEAYRRGYDLRVQGDSLENATLELIANKNSQISPKFTVWLDTSAMKSDHMVYYQCQLQFPTIESEKLSFYDSAEYIADRFAEAASLITYMMKYPIDLDYYSEDDEWSPEEV